jgi:catechol 2,3-dioxygenase-like lactoylglutathione lyase family enzyme
MTSHLVQLCFDAHDPVRLARFWAAALRWDVGDPADGVVALVPADHTRFGIAFRRTTAIKKGQNRTHLDLTTTSVEDQLETVAELIDLGARHIDIGQRAEETHVVLADPEDNELCILAPGNAFLAGCERLGAINCTGLKETGHFWSEVLGWPLVWDQHEETAIRAADGTGPLITWSGPPLMPKFGKNRLYLQIAPTEGDAEAEVSRLVGLGATLDANGDEMLMADPDGNEFRLTSQAAEVVHRPIA